MFEQDSEYRSTVRSMCGSTGVQLGVLEYDWSTGVLSKAFQYQNVQMTVYSGRVRKFSPAISISIIIYFLTGIYLNNFLSNEQKELIFK